MEKANRLSREMGGVPEGGGRGSGGLDRSPMAASGPGVSHQSWGGGVPSVTSPYSDPYASDDVAKGASWDPRRIRDDDEALFGVGGLITDSGRTSSSNAVRQMREEDRMAHVDRDFFVEAVKGILDQIRFADQFLSSEDSVVDLKPFLRPLPEIDKSHLGHVTFRALRDLVIRLATFKDEKARGVRNLTQIREELEQVDIYIYAYTHTHDARNFWQVREELEQVDKYVHATHTHATHTHATHTHTHTHTHMFVTSSSS
jgi:hypothetical protein